jgi:small-conductance mechanosensitive channel
MRRASLILIIVFVWVSPAIAQPKPAADSSGADSVKVAQISLLQLQEQHLLDSLIKISLQRELQADVGDARKVKELEIKLRQIEVNDSLRKLEAIQKINELKKTSKGYPVAPFSDTLFYVYAWVGPYSAHDRAAGITQRIQQLYDDDFLKLDSLKIIKSDNSYDIFYRNDFPVTSVTNLDALWLNTTSEQLAGDYLQKIKTAVQQERANNNFVSWLKKIGWVALIIVGVVVFIFLLNKLIRAGAKLLTRRAGLRFGNIKLLSTWQYKKLVLQALGVSRFIIILLTIYLSLPLLFTIFPATKNLTNTLLGWIIDPAKSILKGLVNFLPNLFTILIVYFFTRYIIKFIKYFANEINAGRINIQGFHQDYAKPTFNIIRFLLYAFMLVIVFPYLPGSSSPAFQGVSVFLGLLLSLGSTSAINNLIAGLVITYMRPFKIGDRIRIGDVTGDVVEKSMLMIRVRTIKNEDVTVPNSTVLSSNTTNFSALANAQGLIIHTTVTIGYDVPWKEMHKALINAAMRTPDVLKDPVPFVLQTSLDDFFVSYQLNAYIRDANNQHVIYSELHQNIQDCCNEAGIEIMSPHYTSMRDGNTTTVPTDYRPKDYKPKAFHVQNVKEKESVQDNGSPEEQAASLHTSIIKTENQ